MLILDTEIYIFAFLGNFRVKKRTGIGSRGYHGITSCELVNSLERCWDNTRHREIEIFTFLDDFRVKKQTGTGSRGENT